MTLKRLGLVSRDGAWRQRHRTTYTRWLVLALLPVLVVVAPPYRPYWLHETIETLGVLCLSACFVGRVWCATYIGGRKRRELVTIGPYSIVRNPLYVFSFIGTVGIALLSEMASVVALAALLFAAYYRVVVAQEEANLRREHGASYEAYLQTVPRWWPAFRRWHDAPQILATPKIVLAHIRDSSWFLSGLVFFESLDILRDLGTLPVLLRLP